MCFDPLPALTAESDPQGAYEEWKKWTLETGGSGTEMCLADFLHAIADMRRDNEDLAGGNGCEV